MTGGRADGRTGGRVVALAAFLLTAGLPDRLSAQVSLALSAGVRYTTTLVHDSIVAPFDVRPARAPALALTVAAPPARGWSPEATLDVSWSTLERHDQDGTTVGLGTLATLAFEVGLRRWLVPGLSGSLAVGGLKYLPSEDSGIFRQGAGAPVAVGTAAVRYAPPFGARHGLAALARYDYHRFITPALHSEGFASSRNVHRVTLALGWSWRGS